MKIKIESWGNDAAIKLPESLLEQLDINIGDPIEVNIVEDKIVISRAGEIAEVGFYKARAQARANLAEILQIKQPSILRIEKRADLYLSTLRAQIESLGGQLDVIARFYEGSFKIDQFSD